MKSFSENSFLLCQRLSATNPEAVSFVSLKKKVIYMPSKTICRNWKQMNCNFYQIN